MAYDKAKRQRERRIEQKLKPSVKPLLKPLLKPIEALKIPEITIPAIKIDKTNRPDMRTFQKFPLPPGSPAPLKQAIQKAKQQNPNVPQPDPKISPEKEQIKLQKQLKSCPTCRGHAHVYLGNGLSERCSTCAPWIKRLGDVNWLIAEKQATSDLRKKQAERGWNRELPILDPPPED